MDVSYRWLARHVDLSGIPPERVARDLTLHTAEVEGLRPFAPVLGDVVVGEVLERERHPDADKLSVCRVRVGDAEPLAIVCGAPNVAAGQRVAVATVGTSLPGDLKIKKAKIRGVESRGMICSERELGLGEDHTGIWVLPPDLPVGRPVAEALGSLPGPNGVVAIDWVIEIDNKSLTHRPDLWGHRGLAREIAALHGRELVPLDTSLPPTGDGTPYPVRVETPNCFRYLGLRVEGVRGGRSPDWMRWLLLAAGQRPLDLLVDVSNFVMLDLGQPNHLFDAKRLSPQGIVVRQARAGETMTTLDGVERRLTPEDMVICSGDEPVALAGVMGGEGSKVGDDTTELVLEVASFHPTVVRRTAARLGLRSEASARFEKHLDPTLPLRAAGHLVRLLGELAPELRLPAPVADAGEWTAPERSIELRVDRARRLLGIELDARRAAELLGRLGFGVHDLGGERLRVDVPSERATKDVSIEEDLIEEIGRLHGYERIADAELVEPVRPVPRGPRQALVRAAQDRLAGGARYHEAPGYSFLPEDLARRLGIADEPTVRVVNPVAEGLERVRRSVVPSLLGLLERNLRHRPEVRLFEIGKGYLPEHAGERGEPREVHEIGLVLAAPRPAPGARFDASSLARLRGVVDDLVRHVLGTELAWDRPAEDPPPWAHPGRAAEAWAPAGGGRVSVALLAALEPGVARALEVDADAAAARISIDALLRADAPGPRHRPLPRYPGLQVDVALAVPADRPQVEVAELVRAAGKGLVRGVELFDLYAGESVGQGRKSLAYHVVLQAEDRTLDDADCQRFLERLERAAAGAGGQLRREGGG